MASFQPDGTLDPVEALPMSDTTLRSDAAAAPIPVGEILPWIVFGVLMLLALYFVGAEEGATALVKAAYVHE